MKDISEIAAFVQQGNDARQPRARARGAARAAGIVATGAASGARTATPAAAEAAAGDPSDASADAAKRESAGEAAPSGTTARPRETAATPTALRGAHADNVVVLRGRVSSAPTERELPSGAVITTLRVSVARARTAMTSGSRQAVDWVDCTAWSTRSRRSVGPWQAGDDVEVTGALRRRFFRTGAGSSTRLEVEVISARRIRPSDPG